MKQGIEILKREDPQARLKTRGYYTYPVYSAGNAPSPGKPGQLIGWRVGQSEQRRRQGAQRAGDIGEPAQRDVAVAALELSQEAL